MNEISNQMKARQTMSNAAAQPEEGAKAVRTHIALTKYRAMVKRLQGPLFEHPLSAREEILLHAAIGIANESGEIMEIVNQTLHYGKAFDEKHLLEEVGDLFHYMTYLMVEYNWSLEDIMRANTEKLTKRYPNGFTTEAALERKDKE